MLNLRLSFVNIREIGSGKMKKNKQILYFIFGSFLYGGVIYLFHSFIWSLFFLLLIGFLITQLVSDTNRSFGKQMLSACIGLFFFGWIAVMIILAGKVLVMYLYSLLS